MQNLILNELKLMSKYAQNNKKFFFKTDEMINYDAKSKILNLSISQDASSVVISTEENLCMIYSFQELLKSTDLKQPKRKNRDKLLFDLKYLRNFIKSKKKITNKLWYKPIIEVDPKQEYDICFAIALGISVILAQLIKGKLIEVKHEEKCNCKFMQWEDDFLILAFENKKIKIIQNYSVLKSFLEDDPITEMKMIHLQDYNLIAFGYNKKVKILHFYSILENNEFYPYIISNLEGDIDIIEHKNQYILFCSKENKIIYGYHFLNNSWKPQKLFEINKYNFRDLDSEQEIINVKLISYEGIIVTFQNKIYLFYFQGNKFEINSIIDESENIFFSSLMNTQNQYYLIYTLQEKIKIIEIEIKEKKDKSSSYLTGVKLEKAKEEIKKCINMLLERKNDFSIKKVDDYNIHIEIDLTILKIEFNVKDLSMNISILKCPDDLLKSRIEEEIEKIKLNEEEKNDDFTEYVTENIIFLNRIIKDTDLSDSISEAASEIDKIKKEPFFCDYKILKNWVLITKKKIPIQNLYNEDDEFDLDNKIIGESIKSLIPKWNFAFDELSIDNAFTFANSDFYSPSIKDKINEEEKKKQQSEKLSNDMAIIYKLNKESFQIYIDKMDEKKIIPYENILILTDILKEIKYYTKEIINQTSNNLIKLYRDNILEILTSLESALRFEFLFICILPLSELIFNELNKSGLKLSHNILNKSPMKNFKFQYRRNSDNEKSMKKKLQKSEWSSDSYGDISGSGTDKDDFFLDAEEFSQNEFNKNYINEFKGNKNNNNCKNKKRFSFTTKISKNSDDFPKNKNNNYGNKTNLSISSNKNEKKLIEILASSFCNTIIDYAIFFSEELKLLKINSSDKKLVDFFNMANRYYETQEIKNEINEISKKI